MSGPIHIVIDGSDGQKVTVFGAVASDGRIGVSATDAPVFLSPDGALDLIEALHQAVLDMGAMPMGYISFDIPARFFPTKAEIERGGKLYAL